jgi:L-cystine uptake protein TcyP (sodium:dicarboxylate symporter family)
MLLGALVSCGISLLVNFTRTHHVQFSQNVLLATLFGAVFGGMVGALIADHKFPP